MSRTLLLLTYHFPPCAAVATHRMVGLARNLPRHGWRTVVVAPPNPPFEPQDPGLVDVVPKETTTVIPVPFVEGFMGKVHRKFFPNRYWVWQATRACRRAIREHRPDALLTSLPPTCLHEIGLKLKRETGIPWIADFRDPWSALRRDVPPWPWSMFDRWKEAETMARADVIAGISPIYAEGLREKYPVHAGKIATVVNGYDSALFGEPASPPPRERLSVLYTGELYFGRDPRPFLDALRAVEATPSAPKVGFHFLGRWSEEYDLPKEVAARQLEPMTTLAGLVPYRECLRTMMQADILLLIHTPGYAHGLPAKIFDYVGARRPILVLTEHAGDIGWVLKESGILHRIAPMNDVPKIQAALLELAREIRRGTPVFPQGEGAAFTREAMAQRFAQHLDALVPTRETRKAARLIADLQLHNAE